MTASKPQIIDHYTQAEDALEKADFWANKDGNIPDRNTFVDRYLSIAQVHATLALAQSMNERA